MSDNVKMSTKLAKCHSNCQNVNQIVKMSIKLSNCQSNCQNVNQLVKMSIKLSKCHNIKCHVLSECVG